MQIVVLIGQPDVKYQKGGQAKMTRKERITLSTAFAPEEIIQAKDLRKISQRDLQKGLQEHEKLGIFFQTGGLKAVMLPVDSYTDLVERLEELEEILEDVQIGKNIEKRDKLQREEWITRPEGMSLSNFFDSALGNLNKETKS